jgi:hypothetical protein
MDSHIDECYKAQLDLKVRKVARSLVGGSSVVDESTDVDKATEHDILWFKSVLDLVFLQSVTLQLRWRRAGNR